MSGRPLAPHDADLVEVDAQQLYEQSWQEEVGREGWQGFLQPWADVPEPLKAVFRSIARNPYQFERGKAEE